MALGDFFVKKVNNEQQDHMRLEEVSLSFSALLVLFSTSPLSCCFSLFCSSLTDCRVASISLTWSLFLITFKALPVSSIRIVYCKKYVVNAQYKGITANHVLTLTLSRVLHILTIMTLPILDPNYKPVVILFLPLLLIFTSIFAMKQACDKVVDIAGSCVVSCQPTQNPAMNPVLMLVTW